MAAEKAAEGALGPRWEVRRGGAESRYVLSVGPQHPGSGHFRILVTLDGDIVADASPDPGYVHRGVEKLAEARNYVQSLPQLERPAIIDACGLLFAYCQAVEDVMKVEVPKRGQYIRVIMAELNRITSHLYWLSIFGIFTGHSTMLMWSFADRELFIDLAEIIGGTRLTFSYFIPGGVRADIPTGVKEKALQTFKYFRGRLRDYDRVFFDNPILKSRTVGVGVLPRESAIELGVVGPVLRGSGVKADVRKDEPYAVYEDLDFEIPVYPSGDSYARIMVRRRELEESMRVIEQCVEKIPDGPVRVRTRQRVPAGEAVSRTESARGEISYYVVSDGTTNPYRLKMNTASFRYLPAMANVIRGGRIADIPIAYMSMDYWPVEADR